MQYELNGTVKKVIYQNTDNWYSVCEVESDADGYVTAVGTMPYVSQGEGLQAFGTWVHSKDYGRQFKVDEYRKILPNQANEILRYLSSGAIKGIGSKIAQKIVEKYGDDSFDVIENHPEWLVDIKGISRKKAYEMSIDFKEKSGVREILSFCNGAISSNNAIKLYKRWGRNALGIIKENPYALCYDGLVGIGFKQVDEIATKMSFPTQSRERIIAAIKYVLEIYASRDGHTFVDDNMLADAVSKLIQIEKPLALKFLDDEIVLRFVHVENKDGKRYVSLKHLYNCEKSIAKKLHAINNKAIHLDGDNISHIIARIEDDNAIQYANMQKKAIWECVSNGVTVLTGGPGTGKTTIIKAVMQIFAHFGLRCALCAPTGRASKRMSEATSCEARTIHRLLDVTASEVEGEPRFLRNSDNHLVEDVIIVDEASMIDISLMNDLLAAIKPGARLILIGDINQLPSVGEGNVLNDIISSECFSTVKLTEIFRQSQNSGIVFNAHKINNGEMPNLTEKYDDFFFIPLEEGLIPEYVASLCKTRLPNKYGVDVIDGIQVISPQKKGVVGTKNLNLILQDKLNPKSYNKIECDSTRERIVRSGDKIMQIRNNYEVEWTNKNGSSGMGVFNGEIGILKSIDNSEQAFYIEFGEKEVVYDFKDIEEFELSYAITVHKSQGSEYPIVIIPLSRSCPPLLRTRNLIYTAITRAAKMVILIGSSDVFFEMISNDTQVKRNTYLELLLRKEAI